jgi:hypothetical protein
MLGYLPGGLVFEVMVSRTQVRQVVVGGLPDLPPVSRTG